jgi:type III secretion protein J
MTALRFLRTMTAALGVLLAACSGQVELVSGLSPQEANEVLAALLRAEINATKVTGKEGVSIEVGSGLISAALNVLQEQGLPQQRHSRMSEIFKREGLISSPLEEKVRYIYALSQELEQTLVQIDGVVAARVHVVLGDRAAYGEAPTPSSASVFLKYKAGFRADAAAPQVKSLVASGIPGLAENKVSVVMFPIGRRAPDPRAIANAAQTRKGAGGNNWLAWSVAIASLAALGLVWIGRGRLSRWFKRRPAASDGDGEAHDPV